MKNLRFVKAVALALVLSLSTSSCIGSFKMYNSMLSWNNQVGNKFVNELVFIAFWILPAYEISFLADVLVLNSIEFWSGNNPMASETRLIDGKDGRYLVSNDENGYTITRQEDGTVLRLQYDADDNAWDAITPEGTTTRLMTFVDDTHVKVPAPDGSDRVVELSQAGLWAYQASATDILVAER